MQQREQVERVGVGEEGRDPRIVPSRWGFMHLSEMGSPHSILVEINDKKSQGFEAEG